jgi:hypothetical protein
MKLFNNFFLSLNAFAPAINITENTINTMHNHDAFVRAVA